MTVTGIKNNYEIRALENANSETPLICLIHGAGGDLHHFDTVAPILVSNGYRVLLFDIRYHGDSQPVDKNAPVIFSFEDIINDINVVLDKVKAEYYPHNAISLIMGGLSLGGMVALIYGSTLNKKEGIVLKGIILLSTCIPYMKTDRPGWIPFADRTATIETVAFVKTAIIESSLHNSIEVQRAIELISDKALYEVFVTTGAALCAEPVGKTYKPLTRAPMLMIWPDQDPHTRDDLIQLDQINKEEGILSKFVTVEDSRHMVSLDQGEKVGEEISKFCSALV